MRSFVRLMGVRDGMSILDLGGAPTIWNSVNLRLNLTILNLAGSLSCDITGVPTHHNICYVEGDAYDVDRFGDRSFDLVFSNSVIEHVGPSDKQASFAREARRLGQSYWVQTPSSWFPIEAHCGMPLWWFYPDELRHYFIERWYKALSGNPWVQYIEETTVLSRSDLMHLFPESTVLVETVLGIPKSNIAYFRGPSDESIKRDWGPTSAH